MRHDAPRGAEAAPHWNAAREGRLLLPHCDACGRFVWPVPARCPDCAGPMSWRECRGGGHLSSYSIVHRAADPALKGDVPYVVAFVVLDEGPRLFTNIVDVQPSTLRCGMRVSCRFEPSTDPERAVAVFAPE